MSGIRRGLARILESLRPHRAERDMAREIEAHLQLSQDEFVARGMTPDEARRAARRAFGGVEQVKERHRDARMFRWLTGWPMDLRLGGRMLVRSPGLTVVGGFALAVAIGAGAAYFEVTRDLLHPSLPGTLQGRVAAIRVWDTERRAIEPRTLHEFTEWRAHATLLDTLLAYRPLERHLITPDGRTDSVRAVEITASAFSFFPAQPILGRPLEERDERPDASPVVVIGYDLWQSRFAADPAILGKTTRLGATVRTIVGVMPEDYAFPVRQNAWVPLTARAQNGRRSESPPVVMLANLSAGTSIEAAQAELQGLLEGASGGASAHSVELRPFPEPVFSRDRGPDEARAVHAGNLVFALLLGLCCANVATLVFARTAARESEIAVRTALGASRARVAAQLFAEALVLTALAAGAGLFLASVIDRWAKAMLMQALSLDGQPLWWNNGLRPETIAYACLLAILAALAVGVIPALKATGANLQRRFVAGATGSRMTFGWLWNSVIVGQTAITVVFAAAVAWLGWHVARGEFSVATIYPRAQIALASVPVRNPSAAVLPIVARLEDEPGIVAASFATSLPGTTWEQRTIELGESASAPDRAPVSPQTTHVGPRFFETVGISVVAGRQLTDAEILAGHNVAVVGEAFVHAYLHGRNPIGLLVRDATSTTTATPGPWYEIVGVVSDVTVHESGRSPAPVLYRPISATPGEVRVIVRTAGAAAPLIGKIQAAALAVDGNLRVRDVRAADEIADSETAFPMRLVLRVCAVVTAVAMLLAISGIYALTSFTLARRTREIGIRIALGVAPRGIVTAVFSRVFMQVGLGALIGVLPAWSVVMALEGERGAPLPAVAVAAGVGACVLLVAIVACASPLRRAMRVDPIQALRADG